MLKRFNRALVAIALGATALVAACTQQPDQKSDQTQPAATSEQPRPAATPTAAPTPVQIAQCVRDGLTADSRTAAQARTLQVNAEVTINGAKQRLAAGQSYWSLCSGPTLEQRLAAAEAQLATANQALTRARADLETVTQDRENLLPRAYVDPNAERSEDNTWKQVATDAQKDARVFGFMLFIAILALGIMGAIWFFTSHPKRPRAARQTTHDLTGVDPRGSATASGTAAD